MSMNGYAENATLTTPAESVTARSDPKRVRARKIQPRGHATPAITSTRLDVLTTTDAPDNWAMVATIAQLSGASVVVSTSSLVLVIAGVAWPLGCIFLARTLFGSDLAVTLSAGVVSVAFSAYPFILMGYGVLWPNFFGMALLPAALALLAVALSAADKQSP